jgi:hypothetical protein
MGAMVATKSAASSGLDRAVRSFTYNQQSGERSQVRRLSVLGIGGRMDDARAVMEAELRQMTDLLIEFNRVAETGDDAAMLAIADKVVQAIDAFEFVHFKHLEPETYAQIERVLALKKNPPPRPPNNLVD